MTTQALRPPLPPHLQPTTKTTSTAKSSHLSATANDKPVSSRASSQSRLTKSWHTPRNEDYASDKATTTLIRRVLCTTSNPGDQKSVQRPVEDLLPPLTSSNDVDLQLYAIIAIIIKEFVNAWYSKITADHVFVEEVVQIIAHCTRALEQRLRRIDLQELILDEVPALCTSHIQAYISAHEQCQSSEYSLDPRHVYHVLNPHPALRPTPDTFDSATIQQQTQNESVYRQLLVQGVFAVLLPTEDLENPCLRTLVGDVVADLILGQIVSRKVCEGWFIYQAISKVAEVIKAHIEPKTDGEEIESATRSRLEQFGLLGSTDGKNNTDLPRLHQSRLSALFWRVLQYGYLAFVFVRFVIVGLLQARTASPRTYPTKVKSSPSSPSSVKTSEAGSLKGSWSPAPLALRRPVLEYRSLTFLAKILDLSTRMPWLGGIFSLGQHLLITGPGRIGNADGLLDRFLSQTIATQVLPPRLLPQTLLALRTSIFPYNTLGPPAPPPPSAEATLTLRREAATKILDLLPEVAVKVYFSVDGKMDAVAQVEETLSIFGDSYCNKHLVFGIIDWVVMRLVPEMEERGVGELLEERIG